MLRHSADSLSVKAAYTVELLVKIRPSAMMDFYIQLNSGCTMYDNSTSITPETRSNLLKTSILLLSPPMISTNLTAQLSRHGCGLYFLFASVATQRLSVLALLCFDLFHSMFIHLAPFSGQEFAVWYHFMGYIA